MSTTTTTAFEIRPLTAADAKAFWHLRREGIVSEPAAFRESLAEHDANSIEMVRERLGAAGSDFVLGAFLGGTLVGSAGFHRQEGEKVRHRGLVWGVYVSPAARGRGAGRQLMQQLIARARALDGLEQLHLQVAETQHAARRLYEALGFRSYGTEPNALRVENDHISEDLMVLRL